MAEYTESKIDDDVQEVMRKKVELALSNEKEYRRTELNFFAELLSTIKKLNKAVDDVNTNFNVAFSKELTSYFEEFKSNIADEYPDKLQND